MAIRIAATKDSAASEGTGPPSTGPSSAKLGSCLAGHSDFGFLRRLDKLALGAAH